MRDYLVSRLWPEAIEQEQAAEEGRLQSRENKRGGRAISYARSRIQAIEGPLRLIYVPSNRGVRSTNASLAAALKSGFKLPSPSGSLGGISRLIN